MAACSKIGAVSCLAADDLEKTLLEPMCERRG